MLIEALIVGALAGLICKGSFKNLLSQNIRGIVLIFVAAAVDIFLSSRLAIDISSYRALIILLLTLKSFAFIYFAYLNRKFWPMNFIAIGELLNYVAIMANGGKMPISQKLLEIAQSSSLTELLLAGKIPHYAIENGSTHLAFLGDIIYFRGLSAGMMSIGDIIMSIGGLCFSFLLFQKPRNS